MSGGAPRPQLDVAIVGGGVSGLYSAWRLLSADTGGSPRLSAWAGAGGAGALRVKVFEGGRRTGGRLLSARPPGLPHVTCELGGMRYVSSQVLVRSLIENELKLPTRPQVVDQPGNIAFLRGSLLRASRLGDAQALPYRLAPAEVAWLRANPGASPAGLIGWAVGRLLPDVARLHGEDLRRYLQTAEIDGVPLYKHGFWNLLARELGSEAYALARAVVGYDSLGCNANAADLALEYFDFTPDVKYSLLEGGYDRVPWTLQQRFEDAGGEVELGAWLDGFDGVALADGSTGVRLRFHDGRPAVVARSLVLAMPRRSIEMLRPEGPVLDPRRAPAMQFMLGAVEALPLYKLFLAYHSPWWEELGVSQGRSVTDLPLRQCYYWAAEGRQPGADPTNRNAVLMAYNDLASSGFWGGLRDLPLPPVEGQPAHARARRRSSGPRLRPFDRRPMPHASAGAGDPFEPRLRANWDAHVAPHAMVREMHSQVMLMHGVQDAPEPLEAAFVDWSDDPYGGAVHFWNIGYRSERIVQDMAQPVPDFPAYVCGEAWSTNQTWVEGALQTAEIVLRRLGVPAPGWVAADG